MRRLIVVVTALTVVSAGLALADGWRIMTVETLGSGERDTSIAVDGNKRPHIAYYKPGSGIMYAYYNGSTWQRIRVVQGGQYCAIAVDSKNRPHIAYYAPGSNRVYYTYYNGSTWQTTAIRNVGAGRVWPDIALDSRDYPYIAFIDPASPDYLFVAYYNGTTWVTNGVESSARGEPSIAVDSKAGIHVTYTTGSGIRYAYRATTTWTRSTVEAPRVGDISSIAVDSSNRPHVSYYMSYYQDLRYAYYNGSTWVKSYVEQSGECGYYHSIALNSSGRPRVAYYKGSPSVDMRYAEYTGTSWQLSNIETAGNVGRFCSLAIDSANIPHVSYVSDSPSRSVKYAFWDVNLGVDLVSFTATAKEAGEVVLRWDVRCTEGEKILGFNLYRQEITAANTTSSGEGGEADAGYQKINRELITGRTPYAYSDAAVIPGKRYEYKLEAVLSVSETSPLGTVQAGGGGARPGAFGILALSPNPTANVINCSLQLPVAGQVELALYDLAGRRIKATTANFGEAGIVTAPVEVAALAPGVYILKASANGASASARAVVTR